MQLILGFLDNPTAAPDLSCLADLTPLDFHGERVGMVLRTRDHVKPIYVTTGHRVSLPSAVELVRQCLDGFRIPQPTREADRLEAVEKLLASPRATKR